MQIQIPCDWKIVDLNTTKKANDFGEALRGYCFLGNSSDTGCYSTFEVIKCLEKVTEGKIFEEAKSNLYEDIEPTVYYYKLEEKDCYVSYKGQNKQGEQWEGTVKMYDPMELVIGWTWDGDGCLYIRFNDKAVVNTDCKKDYTWEWITK